MVEQPDVLVGEWRLEATMSRTADFSPLPFSQRWTAELSEDGRIAGRWDRTGDDGEWIHDFDLTYEGWPGWTS